MDLTNCFYSKYGPNACVFPLPLAGQAESLPHLRGRHLRAIAASLQQIAVPQVRHLLLRSSL